MYKYLKEKSKLLILESGYKFNYIEDLDGGGLEQRFDFLSVIKEHGRNNYNHAFEWCSGFGIIGFELLGTGICNNLHLSDLHYPAILSCKENAELNNLSEKVFTYLSYRIQDILSKNKWDLVVGNPPHDFDENRFSQNLLEQGKTSKFQDLPTVATSFRLTLDHNMEIHKEFFSNIGSKLNDNADIFISSVTNLPKSNPIVEMATNNNLRYVNYYKMPYCKNKYSCPIWIYHFRAT